jgi:hypothetical protein
MYHIIRSSHSIYFMCIGLAIKKAVYDEWQSSAKCIEPPADCIYCPLCLQAVVDADDDWMRHLVGGCPKNKRAT